MGKDTFELAGREWPKVKWWKMKGMRFVYLTLWAAMITSATNGKDSGSCYSKKITKGTVLSGYDGSLMNGLEAMASWNECKYLLFRQRQHIPRFRLTTCSIQQS